MNPVDSPPTEASIAEEEGQINDALEEIRRNRRSPYDVSGYLPVRQELTHSPVRITGELPADLEGVYLRNGTNYQFDPGPAVPHAFTGASMIHQIQIADGRATYSNAYIRNPRFEAEDAAGRDLYPSFSDTVSGPIGLQRMVLADKKMGMGLIPNLTTLERTTSATSIRYLQGRLYCLQETGYAFTLDTRVEDGNLVVDGRGRLETWEGEWEGPFSAHPRVAPDTGDVYNLSLEQSGTVIAGLLRGGELTAQTTVHHPTEAEGRMGWLHDFFLTENYLIFPDISLRADLANLLGPDGSMFRYDDSYRLRWGVIPRDFTGEVEVRWFETDRTSMIWHVINGWERIGEDGSSEVVLHGHAFASYPANVPIHTPEEPPAQVKTWVLNFDTGKVTDDRVLIDHGYERPSLNLDYVGRPSRFCYLLDEHGDGYMGKGVLKYDLLDEKEIAYLDYGDMYGGEALFVPRAGATAEDDGYLIDLLMSDDRADLVVIDARNMAEVARLHLPQRVPFGVHATWLTTEEIATLAQ
jgi:carotenoid cleavage dioxygenase